MTTTIRTVNVELTSDDARYILHALEEFKKSCRAKVDADEDGEDELTPMYADDIMQAKLIYEKIRAAAEPVFGEDALVVSYDIL